MEGNCHLLEFPAPKTHVVRSAAELAGQAGESAQASELSAPAKSGSALAAATLTQDAAHRDRWSPRERHSLQWRFAVRQFGDWRSRGTGTAGRCAISLRYPAGHQAIERQVRLYCFRLDKCGTFMPLFCVRGKSKIAAVWNLFAAVFSAVAPVPFRVLSTHGAVLSTVDCR